MVKHKNTCKKIDPLVTKIIDRLDPDSSFPVYLAYLPFGSLKGDTKSTLLPDMNGGNFRLTDSNINLDLLKHLGYSIDRSPFGMVLEKELEYFIDLKNEQITIPRAIYTPGMFFSSSNYLGHGSKRSYSPNTVLTVSSGARSTFMLPNIGCVTNHANLQREYNIQNPAPKSLYNHWHIFKRIVNSKLINCDWRSCVLYFSQKWLDKLYNDEAWLPLKMYLHEQAWKYFEFDRNRSFYDIAFSTIQKYKNLKPNPYLADTAKHLFTIALGDAPGFTPAYNENLMPFKILQQAFVHSYGLENYLPTIMQPTRLIYEKDHLPVYYSLQNPSTYNFSPKSRKTSSTTFEMRELHHIMQTFIKEFHKDSTMCADSVIGEVAKNIVFNYYHNKQDLHMVINPSINLPKLDERFQSSKHAYKSANAKFAADAPFLRGCISIGRKTHI